MHIRSIKLNNEEGIRALVVLVVVSCYVQQIPKIQVEHYLGCVCEVSRGD